MSDDERATIAALILELRKVAEPAGPLHGWWDRIGDMEAMLRGEPTIVQMTPAELIEDARQALRRWAG